MDYRTANDAAQPITMPGGAVQSGGYMNQTPDKPAAIGVSNNSGRSDQGSGAGGAITSIFKAIFSS